MKAFIQSLLAVFLLPCSDLPGAASVQLPHEWAAPLEEGKAMALVQTETGQARIIVFKSDFSLGDAVTVRTDLPGVTGVNTGLFASGGEHVIISSIDTNGVRFLNSNDFSVTSFQPEVPGPVTAIPLRQFPGDPPSIHQLSKYGDASEVVRRYSDLFAASPTPLGVAIDDFPIYDLQPARIPGDPGAQAGVFSVLTSPGGPRLYEIYADGANVDYKPLPGTGSADERLVADCLGSDGRSCVIRYQPGEITATIVTRPYSGFSEASQLSDPLPFPIGTISAVPPGVAGAPHGVIVSSEDGTTAIYAHIIDGKTFSSEATFVPQGSNLFAGVLAIPGRGIVALEGPAGSRATTSWQGYQSSGGAWTSTGSGLFGAWLPPQTDFATLFWFNSTPLVDPTAEIIKLETQGDWTRKTSPDPIPPGVELSQLADPQNGLVPFSSVAPIAPPGAKFLLTSQPEDFVSITALGSDLTIQTPALSISPPSGDYDRPLTVTALFDEGGSDVFMREDQPGSPWVPFETLTVGYPSSWLFYARSQSTGVASPIQRRDYTFSSVDLNSLDSDNDGVPDYVERDLGLDPAGGADSDGDFQSDLEEILNDTDPADHESNTPPEDPRNAPFLGEGFELIAQAFDASGQGASPANPFDPGTAEDDFPGETLRAFDMHGQLLAEANVSGLAAPPALAGQDGAFMQVGTPVDEASWITLTSPTSFGVLDVLEPARTGREILKVMQRPVNPVAEVVTSPTGTDRAADAQAWITAAKATYGSHETIGELTELRPIDNALSALAEQALFDALQTLDEAIRIDLGVPTVIEQFTLFPQRNGESARTPFSSEMWEELRNAGWDFPALFASLETVRMDSTMVTLANSITSTYVANSGINPLMALPFDAFRSIIRTGSIVDPAPGDPPRSDPYGAIAGSTLTTAKTSFDDELALVSDFQRSTETWFIVIAPSTTPLHDYDYQRQGTSDKVWLVDRFGDRVLLEQGLGLAEGTIFEITGYPDVTAPAGFLGFEPIRIESVVAPQASDTDANGNLLDDDWEQVFFGELGVVDPFEPHPVTSHSYLQYHLSGADPRSGSLDSSVPVLTVFPHDITFTWVPVGSFYNLSFDFPAEFVDRFDFVLQSSSDLGGFAGPANIGPMETESPGTYSFRIETSESNLEANFFRIGISLK